MTIHLIKLVVGVKELAELAHINEPRQFEYHGRDCIAVRTRRFPRRREELLKGGSLYRVIKGRVVARQEIAGFEEGQDPDGRGYCRIICDANMMMTVAKPHRPFQGWRYLRPADAPKDRGWFDPDSTDEPPPEMAEDLKELGLW